MATEKPDVRAKLETLIWAWPHVGRPQRAELLANLDRAMRDDRWPDGPDWITPVDDAASHVVDRLTPDSDLSEAFDEDEMREMLTAFAEEDASAAKRAQDEYNEEFGPGSWTGSRWDVPPDWRPVG